MNQLSGKYVNVVLSVERGRGMEFLKNHVHIAGNFNNRILESDKIAADDRPQFNTELVWEVDKKDLRKIRSANQPLRVECISTDSYNRKERVGFALLSLRSAHIIPLKNAGQEVNFKWHKLIGCQTNKKKFNPEVYLSLTIRDHLISEPEASSSGDAMPFISEEDTSIEEELLTSQFPITYLEDGYIRIGEDDIAQSAFTLNLFVKEAMNLDTLLPEILVFQQNNEKCYMSFRILGVTIKTKSFKELHDTITLNEKIVVKLLSDQDVLEEFFKSQSISINFYCGQDKMGMTVIELGDIFSEKESKCYFKYPSPNGIIPFMDSEKSPFIEVRSWLEQEEKEVTDETEEEEKPKPKIVFSDALRQPDCSGDQPVGYVLDKLEKINVKSQSDSETPKQDIKNVIKPLVTKSVDTVIKNIPLSPKLVNPLETYQRYVLEVSLKNLLWKKPPKDTKIIFKFLHPKAASYITIFTEVENSLGENVILTNLNVKIMYVSTLEKIKNLLNAWPPKLVLMDEKEKSLSEEYEFSVILSNNMSDHDVTLKVARTMELLAKVGVTLNLNESSLNEAEEKSDLMLLPAVLDEVISVKEINDIDKWKETEKNKFEDELEKIKAKEVKKLQDEWQLKKDKMEEQLNKNISRCKKLQEELQNKANTLKTEKYLISKRNGCNLYEDIFKENWKNFHEDNTKDVIELLSKTQRDNEHLKEIINEQRKELDVIQKSTLTKAQTSNLLQELRVLEEKFEEVQNAKSYFKEQWKIACDEVHQLKTEDIEIVQNQIQQNKEQLSQISLDKFSNFESAACPDIYNSESVSSGTSGHFYF